MSNQLIADLGAAAEGQWGLITAAQALEAGASRMQLSRLTGSGVLVRVAHGVYRFAGAPALEHEEIFAAWLALGGAEREPASTGVPALVAAGTTAARLHAMGNFWLDRLDFLVPSRRGTRLAQVRLRVRPLRREDVTIVDGLPVLTAELTLADLVGEWTDLSLVADALRDGYDQVRISMDRLAGGLQPLAAARGYQDGRAFADVLLELAEVEPAHAR